MNIEQAINEGIKMIEYVRDNTRDPWLIYIADIIEQRPELEVFKSELGHAFFCGALAGCVITMHKNSLDEQKSDG